MLLLCLFVALVVLVVKSLTVMAVIIATVLEW